MIWHFVCLVRVRANHQTVIKVVELYVFVNDLPKFEKSQERTKRSEDATVRKVPNSPEPTPEYLRQFPPIENIPSTNFVCPVCGRSFTTQKMLTIHLDVAHKKK